VAAIEAGLPAGRSDSGALRTVAGFEEPGLYRLRSASDQTGPSAFANELPTTLSQARVLSYSLGKKLLLPVLLLVATLCAICLGLNSRLPVLTGERWLTVSHALVPLAFFVVALANRRYGPSYAFGQVAVSVAIALIMAAIASGRLRALLPHAELGRLAGAFGVSFVVASFVSIIMFDSGRGPRWWLAPLLGLLSAIFVFCAVFYPAAYGGTQTAWIHQMFIHLGLAASASVVLLLPYWLLRAAIRPLSGYGGY
jgi:uncharacterized PurR-regulated membrane protein YhhQ (DUF165 family)